MSFSAQSSSQFSARTSNAQLRALDRTRLLPVMLVVDQDEGPMIARALVLQPGVEVDPGLVGGVRVFVDNRMIDNSVQGRLDGLSRKLREARLGAG